MQAKRWELNLYSFYDHTGMERHLEKMAAKGWLLDSIGTTLWRYRRIEPQKLRFSVAYYPDATESDPITPSEGELTFWDYCAKAGWVRAANRAQLHIFYNTDENAVPIETEAVTQVETLHRAAKKNYLLSQWLLLGMALLYTGFGILGNSFQALADILALRGTFMMCLAVPTMFLISLSELIGYYRWRRRAVRNAHELGRFTPTRSLPGVQLLTWLLLALITLTVLTDSWTVRRSFLAYFAAFFVVRLTHSILRRMNASATVNRTVTIIVDIVVFLVLFVLFLPRLAQEPPPPNAEPYEYTYHSMGGKKTVTEYAYHDPLPLYVEDLTETDYDRYSCKREDSSTPLVTRQIFSQETRWGDWDSDAPELRCTIYDIRLAPLFAPCLQGKLDEYADRKWRMLDYREADAAPWGADRAWQLWDTEDSTPCDSWLLVYGCRIVIIDLGGIEMDGVQMALVGERLGGYAEK